MSEQFEKIQDQPSVQTDESIPIPPPRKKAKRQTKKLARQNPPGTSDMPSLDDLQKAFAKSSPNIRDFPSDMKLGQFGNLSVNDIRRAKAVLAQAEAALGVAQPKKEAPVPLHPQRLEDPAQGDKTPAVVEWYAKNAPEEYERRYAGRKTHLADRRKERRYEPFPAGATPATFPADPDGFQLSQRDDSGSAPRNFRDI